MTGLDRTAAPAALLPLSGRNSTAATVENRDDEVHRYLKIATLHEPFVVTATDAPRLFDVRIIRMSPQAFTLTGFERIEGVEFAQSWIVTPA